MPNPWHFFGGVNMFSRKALRVSGLAVSIVAAASMVATPTYAYAPPAIQGQHVQFRTSAAALEIVKRERPALYQRLLAYQSGQNVRVTSSERAYLQRVNQKVAAKQARATEFSSQSRKVSSSEARMAYAQASAPAAKTQVLVTPLATPGIWERIAEGLKVLGPAAIFFFPVAAPFIALAVIIINLIIAAIAFVAKWGPELAKAWGAVAASR